MKPKSKFLSLLLLALTLGSIKLSAQTGVTGLTTVIPPSPNAQAIQKFGNIPVSPYTGVPNINIPLYAIQYHDITIPISIGYHASGIKVQEEASSVGLGWALNAGGIISRTIVGNDDFNPPTGPYFNPGTFTNGVFTKSGTTALDIDNGLTTTNTIQATLDCQLALKTKNQIDSVINITSNLTGLIEFQPDQYTFSLPGKNGKFILDRNYNAIIARQAKIQISCLNASGSAWKIISEDGFVYDFTQIETVKYSGEATQRNVSWYLTQITSPLGNIVTFNYANDTANESNTSGEYFELFDDKDLQANTGGGGIVTPTNLTGHVRQITKKPANIYSSVRLVNIDYNSGRVVFNYSSGRQDLNASTGFELDGISVYSKDNQGNVAATPLKTYSFAYSYFRCTDSYPGFIPTPTPPTVSPIQFRLKLNSITESGTYNGQTVTSNPYLFTYYQSSNGSPDLPNKSSYSRDHWGYFNAYNNTRSLLTPTFRSVSDINNTINPLIGITGNERDSNPSVMQAFSLKSIQYPTGGNTLFEYEANDCDEQASTVNDHSGSPYLYSVIPSPTDANHLSNFAWYNPVFYPGTPNPQQILDNKNIFLSNNNDRIQSPNYVITFVLDGNESIGSSLPGNQVAVQLTNLDNQGAWLPIDPAGYTFYYLPGHPPPPGTTSTYTLYSPNDHTIMIYNMVDNLTAGKYKWEVTCLNTSWGAHVKKVTEIYPWYTQVNSNAVSTNSTLDNVVTYSTAGGLRIKRITDHDGINSDKIRRYFYHYFADKNSDKVLEEYSYGRRMSRPEYSYFQTTKDAIVVGNPGNTVTYTYDGEHLMRTSDSNIALNGSAEGAVVGYDQVTELYGENGENGQTVYKFHNNPDEVDAYYINTASNSSIYTLLFRKRPYNSNISDPLNGSLIEQMDYKNSNGQLTLVKDVVNNYNTYSVSENKIYGFEVYKPQGYNVWVYDGSSTPTVLGNCGKYLFTYTPLQSEWVRMVSTDTKTYGISDPSKFQETITNYAYENPKHYLLTRIDAQDSKGNVQTTKMSYPLDFTTFNPSDPISNGIQNLILKHVYTAPIEKYVQVTGTNSSNGVISGSISVYKGSGLPVIDSIYQLQTAVPILTTGFTSLSFTTTSTNKNAAYYTVIAFDSYDASNGNLQQQHKKYDIAYSYQWAYNKAYPIAQCKNAASNEIYFEGFEDSTVPGISSTSAHTGTKSCSTATVSWTRPNGRSYVITYWCLSTTTGKWTLSPEQAYTGSSFTMTGGSLYDDIRIFPNDAELTTYTYDTLVGMTSSTDPKGMTTYYEYDGLQRLMNIKDKDGNIVKNYQYHFEPQP